MEYPNGSQSGLSPETHVTRTELIELVHTMLREATGGTSSTAHSEEHEFLRMQMRAEKRRIERINKIQASVIGGITLAVLGALVSVLGWVAAFVVKHYHP